MTANRHFLRSKFNPEALTSGQIAFGLFGLFCLLLILRNSSIAIEYMSRGLRLCAHTVIPSLFPFMVLSELIVSGGIGKTLLRQIGKPFCRLFRLSADGCCAVLLGMLCGFPIGARSACLSYRQGQIGKNEAERILCFSNNPSSAFLITAVGGSLWGNPRFGIALYLTVLLSALITGALVARLPMFYRKEDTQSLILEHIPPSRGAMLFTEAMRASVRSILLVCAYVVFFSALIGTFNFMPGVQKLPAAGQAILFCLFELSTGMSQAATLANPTVAALLCAFCAGWSGISVHCQALAICDKSGLSLQPYILAKLFQSLLAPLLFAAVLALFPSILIPAVGV
ncbi:MAG: hypothetical protein IJW16_08665 [Clostridia bacterium]|nr:hypothetical protein [Clostridia bacterium]